MSEQHKPILCLDFDGVIHSYDKGWQNGEIYGEVTLGFFEWALEAQKLFKLVVYSSRSKTEDGLRAMQEWLDYRALRWLETGWGDEGTENTLLHFEYAHEKPPAFLTIDDRAVTFNGDWSAFPPEALRAFTPWNVR